MSKGGASKSEQQAADSMRQQELNMMQTQMGMINPSLQAIIGAGGMLPQQEAAMRSLAMNNLGEGFRQATGNVNQAMVARGMTGGENAGAGGVASGYGALQAAMSGNTLNALENVQLAKGQGLMQAMGLSAGLAGQFNQGANSALNSGVTAAHNVDQASTGLWGSLLGGALGLGSMFMPGGQVAKGLGWFSGASKAGGQGV